MSRRGNCRKAANRRCTAGERALSRRCWAAAVRKGNVRCTAMAALGLLLLAGCAGHASIHLVPLGGSKISTTAPLVQKITPDECYYWVNEKNELCLAMREVDRSIWGKRFEGEFILSLVLEGLPAGAARDYRVSRRTLRARLRAGYRHTRAASLGGIVGVWDYDGGELKGRFRMSAKHQTYSILTGWGGNAAVLFVGEFTAVLDRPAGEKILARTEERGMERPPPGTKPKRLPGASRIVR